MKLRLTLSAVLILCDLFPFLVIEHLLHRLSATLKDVRFFPISVSPLFRANRCKEKGRSWLMVPEDFPSFFSFRLRGCGHCAPSSLNRKTQL